MFYGDEHVLNPEMVMTGGESILTVKPLSCFYGLTDGMDELLEGYT